MPILSGHFTIDHMTNYQVIDQNGLQQRRKGVASRMTISCTLRAGSALTALCEYGFTGQRPGVFPFRSALAIRAGAQVGTLFRTGTHTQRIDTQHKTDSFRLFLDLTCPPAQAFETYT
jgi:hypothetical protein